MREWLVASALVEVDGALLLVRNERRGGFSDWSTPGGVIDADDRSVLTGLTREVEEETGLRVTDWEGPVYEVRAVALEMGWRLHAEVYRALAFEGELCVADPDGIVDVGTTGPAPSPAPISVPSSFAVGAGPVVPTSTIP